MNTPPRMSPDDVDGTEMPIVTVKDFQQGKMEIMGVSLVTHDGEIFSDMMLVPDIRRFVKKYAVEHEISDAEALEILIPKAFEAFFAGKGGDQTPEEADE